MSNADALRAAFAAADTGDAAPLLALLDDSMTWAGFTLEGTQSVYTKEEFLGAFGVLAKLDESSNEVVWTDETKEGLVVAYVRAYRRLGEKVLDFTMVTSYQFVDGTVRRATDMCPPEFGRYWADLGFSS
jgi:ketosteroid isomerase-like protein